MKQKQSNNWTVSPLLGDAVRPKIAIGDRVWVSSENILNDILAISEFDYLTTYGNTHSFEPDKVFVRLLNFLRWLDYKILNTNTTYIEVYHEIFISFFGKHYTYYLKLLKCLNILIRVPHDDGTWYEKGVQSCRYRITNHYRNSKRLAIAKFKPLKRVQLKIESLQVDPKFRSALTNSVIDFERFIEEEINLIKGHQISMSQFRVRVNQVLTTYQRRFIKPGKNVNRIYHSFSNVPRSARKNLISPTDQKYFELDIANCHPSLLIIILRELNLHIDENYIEDVEKGRFYNRFIGLVGEEILFDTTIKIRYKEAFELGTKNDVKPRIFSAILFDFKQNHPVAQKFKELYPRTFDSLKALHSHNDVTLASRLQNWEASVFNRLIPNHSKHFFTLHDAIYFTDYKDYDPLRKRISRIFKKHGIVVRQRLVRPYAS